MNFSVGGQARLQILALALIILFGLAMQLPHIWNGKIPVNLLALKTVHICAQPLSKEASTQTAVANANVQTAWLLGVAANCTNGPEVAHNYWKMLLNQVNTHLPLIRASQPVAVELATVAASNMPDNALANFWLGDALLAQEDNSGAVAAYEQALLILGENDANTWMKIGRLYEAAGDWQAAVHAYDLACEYWDKGKNGCPNAGRLYMARGQYELAFQRYQDSLTQLPNWRPAINGVVEASLAMNQPDKAVPYLQILADGGDSEAAQLLQQIKNDTN